jgi:hypothetical protein
MASRATKRFTAVGLVRRRRATKARCSATKAAVVVVVDAPRHHLQRQRRRATDGRCAPHREGLDGLGEPFEASSARREVQPRRLQGQGPLVEQVQAGVVEEEGREVGRRGGHSAILTGFGACSNDASAAATEMASAS